jgi:hypothetical protein
MCYNLHALCDEPQSKGFRLWLQGQGIAFFLCATVGTPPQQWRTVIVTYRSTEREKADRVTRVMY